MKYAFRFSHLIGSVYKCANVCFTPDGSTLLSPVGNRITCFDLVNHSSYTLDVETRSDISRIALSPDGRLLLAVDVDGYVVAVNFPRRVIVHRFRFKAPVRDVQFSPDGQYLALTYERRLQVWRAPGLEREFAPFVLHRTYTGHHDDITCIAWSPNGLYIATGSADMTVRVYSRDPIPGYIPVTLSGHRDAVVGVWFAEQDVIYTVSRDAAVFTWTWMERAELGAGAFRALRATAAVEGSEDEEDAGDSGQEAPSRARAGTTSKAAPAGIRRPRSASASESSGASEAGDGEIPAAAGRKRRRSDEWVRVDGTVAAAMERKAGRGASVRDVTDSLLTRRPHAVPAPFAAADAEEARVLSVLHGEWVLKRKGVFKQDNHARVVSAQYHARGALLVVGFSTGTFGLYSMPDTDNVHTLSISSHAIHTLAINSGGDWIAFGSRDLGQLLVWEWKTETYVMKQQGHFYDLNTVAYSANGQLMATGGDDGKVKVWNVSSGFCFVTFAEHTAPVTAVTFIGGQKGHGLAILSASLDGTVRAYDLVRYRTFRTLTPPEPAQLISLATDDTGEVVIAGAFEPFSIYSWSLQTGKLLDVFTGHEGPVCSLQFNKSAGLLISGSWDKTARVWDVFRSGTSTETYRHGSDVLAVAFRPDGAQACVSTLDGQLHFWDVKRGIETSFIDCRRDAAGGRKHDDARMAKTSAAGKSFSTIAYTADGDCVLAGGRSKYVCLYAVAPRLLVRKWQVSHNRSLDGVLDKLNSKGVGEGGILATLDLETKGDDAVAARVRAEAHLPGVKRGDLSSKRALHPEIRTKAVQFSPTNRAFAVASTEGLLVYSLDDSLVFDPFEIGEHITAASVAAALERRHFGRALLMALHLNETSLIARAVAATPLDAMELVVRTVPAAFVQRLVDFVAEQLGAGSATPSPYLDFYLRWALALLLTFGQLFRERPTLYAGSLRSMQRALIAHRETFGKLVDSNRFALRFMCDAAEARAAEEASSLV